MSPDGKDTLGFPSLPHRSDAPASEQPRNGPDDQAMTKATLGAATLAPAPGADWVEQERRAREEEQRAWQSHWAEQREVRAIDADTDARRAKATSAMVRGGAVVGGATLAGLAVAGPVGGVVGGVVGWIADHLLGRSLAR